MLRFFIFFLILVALFAAELTPLLQRVVVLPWTEALAHVCASVLTLFDSGVVEHSCRK
jgi:hypothetical protein